jgi:hypothetical protein
MTGHRSWKNCSLGFQSRCRTAEKENESGLAEQRIFQQLAESPLRIEKHPEERKEEKNISGIGYGYSPWVTIDA